MVLEETWIYESTSSSSLDAVGIDDCHSGAVLDIWRHSYCAHSRLTPLGESKRSFVLKNRFSL